MFKKKNKKQIIKNEGTSIWINEVGGIKIRIFKIEKDEGGYLNLIFSESERYKVKEKNLRAKRILFYKTSSGRVIVQDPEQWKNIKFNEFGIKELRFNLQNFGLQESKAAIHRWTIPKDMITKLSPLFKLMFICIVVGVACWSVGKFGTYVLEVVMNSRLMDCSNVLPQVSSPIGANAQVPIGA